MDKTLTRHLENRSQSRDRVGNYNNDYTRGRSRDRNNERPVRSRQSTLSHGRDDLGPNPTLG